MLGIYMFVRLLEELGRVAGAMVVGVIRLIVFIIRVVTER